MYTLMIVDDDELICRGLGTCIEWEKLDVEVIGMFYDGVIALEKMEDKVPDIMIVDINMPFMSGIELSSIIREKYPRVKIILLTAYKEFEYAQEAIRLKVFDYITKPFYNSEVSEVVKRAVDVLEEEKKSRKEILRSLDGFQEKQIQELVLFGVNEDADIEIVQSMDNFFMVAILYVQKISNVNTDNKERYVEDEIVLLRTIKQISELLRDYQCKFFQLHHRVVIVYEYENREEARNVGKMLLEVMDTINQEDDILCYSSMGRVYQGVEKAVLSYNDASYAIEQRYGYANKSIIPYSDIKFTGNLQEIDIIQTKHMIKRHINMRASEELEEEITKLCQLLCQNSQWSTLPMGIVFMNLLGFAYESTEDMDFYSQYIKQSNQILGRIAIIQSNAELSEYISECFKPLYTYLSGSCLSEGEQRVNQAVEYMEEKFKDQELNLAEVAKHVNLSANYLGNLIKKHKNISYINLLNQIRIDEAKRLLMKPETKNYEVAFLVGFNSSQYFSSCFKRATGQTPSEFKSLYVK